MIFAEQKIAGVFLIYPEAVEDERGKFRRFFCAEEFLAHGIDFQICQSNFSENRTRFTLRGLHYRAPQFAESKVLTCVRGKIHNVIVDLRKNSSSFLRWISVELSEQNGIGVFLPHGCANGFLTLQDNTSIHYYHSTRYQPGADVGIRYDDPSLAIQWPHPPCVISQKDQSLPLLSAEFLGV